MITNLEELFPITTLYQKSKEFWAVNFLDKKNPKRLKKQNEMIKI
jgi:hypothetical protein